MADDPGAAQVWRTLRITNFRNYMVGNFISQVGLWTQRVGVQWLTWQLTGSPTWLGIIAFADFFPNIVMAPLAGALADRLDMPRTAVRLVSGATSRRKLIEVDGLDAEAALDRLLNHDRSAARTKHGSKR